MEVQDGVFSCTLRSMGCSIWNQTSSMKYEEWAVLERKERSLIRLCLVDLVLLNVFEESTLARLWKKLGDLFQAKSLVNKFFM